MKKTQLIKSIIFCIAFLIIFSFVSMIIVRKNDAINSDFYCQERNSIDVLYLGSSHAYSSISPMDMYNEYGFTGYVRASSCQRSWESYTLLEESLKYQQPKVVVYEVMSSYHDEAQLETFSRDVFDAMRPSKTMVDGVLADIEGTDTDILSYLIPMFRYHDRWETLNQDDFEFMMKKSPEPTKGFMVKCIIDPVVNYDPNRFNSDAEPRKLSEKSEKYIRKMKKLCDDNGISFVMVKVPTEYVPYWDVSMYKGIKELADDMEVPFIDYNVGENKLDIDWSKDTDDQGNHLNYYGAQKTTKAIGKYLNSHFDLPDHRDKHLWSESEALKYSVIVTENLMISENSFLNYLKMVNESFGKDDDYLIIITSRSNVLNEMPEDVHNYLLSMGDDLVYSGDNAVDPNAFIVRNGNVLYKKQDKKDIRELVPVERHTISIVNLGDKTGDCCDINIDGKEMGKNSAGLNIIIYNVKTGELIDSIFSKYDENGILAVYR